MRCVASAISCRRRSTSCCQRSATSDELHKLLCGICPLSSFDIFFPFSSCQFSAIGLGWSEMPFSSQERRGQAYQMYILLLWKESNGRLPREGDTFPSLFHQFFLPAELSRIPLDFP